MEFSSAMAGNAYRLARKYDKAKDAFEKASKGQEMLASYVFFIYFDPVFSSTDSVYNCMK